MLGCNFASAYMYIITALACVGSQRYTFDMGVVTASRRFLTSLANQLGSSER